MMVMNKGQAQRAHLTGMHRFWANDCTKVLPRYELYRTTHTMHELGWYARKAGPSSHELENPRVQILDSTYQCLPE